MKEVTPNFLLPPLPSIIIYNYILLLHTHIHPVAPLMDYQLTNTTEEKKKLLIINYTDFYYYSNNYYY